MITVVIPTLNEEEHIESVIRFAQKQPNVTEVIVVDDKSLDNTVTVALAAGARVITSTKLGKGTSMKEGVMNAANNIVVFLDGDIDPYPHYTIKLLTDPIINGEAEFVKASFSPLNLISIAQFLKRLLSNGILTSTLHITKAKF